MDPRRTLIAALAAPLVLLAACGGDDTSVADPPVSPSSTSSSPTTPPKRETPEHFIRRWAQAEKRMENTGLAETYLSLSRSCGPCEKLAQQVRRYYDAGGYVRWGGWTILTIKPYPGKPAPLFAVHSNSSPTTYKSAANAPTRHFSGGSITYVLALKRLNGSWAVTNKSELSS
jgi:hypothetical protein